MSNRQPTAITLVGFDAEAGGSALAKIRAAIPGASTAQASSVEEATRAASLAKIEILVMANPSPEQLSSALQAVDEEHLPRWAVVIVGDEPTGGDLPALAPSELDSGNLRLAIRWAIRERALRRENALFRGDLRTIGSRVNHDLRAPLSAVYTTCEVIRELLAEGAPPESGLLDSISDSADELTRLADRLALMVRATADPRPAAAFWMAEVVTRALDRLQSRIQHKNARVVQPESWPDISGVACWVEAIWCAFLESALQHDVEHPRIDLGWRGNGREILFWLRTPGAAGAAAGRPLRILPFHMLHDRRGSAEIGLSVARRLVELQGGHCGYLSAAEGGPGLYFTLPSDTPGSGPASTG